MPIAEIDSGMRSWIKTKTGLDDINVGIAAATNMYIHMYIYIYIYIYINGNMYLL